MPIAFWDRFTEGYEGSDYPLEEWDRVQIGGYVLPGICVVDGAAKQRIDVQKANGVDGGVLIERGYQPGTLDIDMKIWTPHHWSIWQSIHPNIYRRAGKLDVNDAKKKSASRAQIQVTAKAALSIYHPAAADRGIDSVLIEQITLPRPGPEKGSKIITIKCIQYMPPSKLPAVRKATGVKAPPQDPRQKFHPAANKPDSPAGKGEGGP
jgi:hypothetical protein